MRARPVVTVALVLLTAIGLGARAARAADVIRVGFIPVSSNLPLWCGMDTGAFAAEGVEIQPTLVGRGSRMVEAMVGGSLDMGMIATLTLIQAAERGLDVALIAPAGTVGPGPQTSTALVSRKTSGIAAVAQLRGKIIGVNQLGNHNYMVVAETLSRAGIGKDQVTWQEIDFPHMVAALEQGRIDAANLPEPYLTTLRDAGWAAELATQEQVAAGLSIAAYAVLRPWYDAHRPLVERFQRGIARGLEACQRDPVRMRDILARATRLPPDTARRIGLAQLRPTFTRSELDHLMELARRHRLIDRGLAADRLVAPGGFAP